MEMSVAAYCRKSINSQEHSIETQKFLAREAAAKFNLVIDEYYIDDAISAKKTKIDERSSLKRLLDDIESEKVTTLFVYKRDRLARNVEQYMEIYELFKRKNVNVIFTAENEISLQYTPAGEFFELIMAGFNEREVDQIHQRIRETKNTMVKQGKLQSGRIPYGYIVDKEGYLIPDKNVVNDIKFIFTEFVEQDFKNFSAFVKHINDIGIKYKAGEKATAWKDSNLRTLIRNPVYIGIRFVSETDGEKYEFQNESLKVVDENLWKTAQRKYELNYSRKKNVEVDDIRNIGFLLNGLVVCGKCGVQVNGKVIQDINGQRMGIYQCNRHKKYMMEKKNIEKQVLKKAKSIFLEIANVRGKKIIIQDFKSYEEDYMKKVKKLEEKISTLENELASMSKEWLNNKSNEKLKEKMFEKLDDIKKKKEELSKYKYSIYFLRKYPIEERFDYYKSNFNIEQLNVEQQIELIKDVVDRIYLGPGTNVMLFKFPTDVVTNIYENAII
ncbi:hypothetical protein BHF71_09990 [Vulcanibacillus modesticaldus]|uniref:Uncharacterized protein n=1 Tax=Vulcanibacillus modesticaldus TaxID=337097 RepID=A0A1D2YU28_9BACI|nr:recombinase family protein [Vulcanibacillus modesticaldus]OEF99155.1 hypothetical protein BHF71_09990 [Vulcanibacillus modesticaldus]